VKHIPPPTSSASTFDHRELVGDLRATEHHRVGPHGGLGELAQHLDLGEHEPAGVRRKVERHVVHRRLLAVHHPETVGDEHPPRARQRGELTGQRGALVVVLRRLARVEPDVLQHHDIARGHLGHALGELDQAHRGAEQLAEAGGDRCERERRIRPALRPAEVRDDDHLRTLTGQLRDRGHRCTDAAVNGDVAAVERHVQVRADERRPAGHALGDQVEMSVHGRSTASTRPGR
jgi:hypothetical protein